MNDRFKFRCFSKKTKKMYEVDSLHLDSENEWVWVHYYNPIYDKDLKIQIEQPNAIIMQSTGKKDCNGKFIYENDIVRLEAKNGMKFDYLVKYKDYQYILEYIDGKYKGHKARNFSKQYAQQKNLYKHGYMVIGNIYENKELLEDTECQK